MKLFLYYFLALFTLCHTEGKAFEISDFLLIAKQGNQPSKTDLLKEKWNTFFQNTGSNGLFVEVSDSTGSLHVCDVLTLSPKNLQKRIVIIAIDPTGNIPENLCCQVYNYRRKPHKFNCAALITKQLKKHSSKSEFLDPTLKRTITESFKKHIETD